MSGLRFVPFGLAQSVRDVGKVGVGHLFVRCIVLLLFLLLHAERVDWQCAKNFALPPLSRGLGTLLE